jgi:uncharacterized protein YegL
MKNDLTEIVFILDRSGSMHGLEKDTIGGYNAFVESQKKVEGKARMTTVLFDDQYELLYSGRNIQEVRALTGKEYFTRGSTALLDAIGKTITDVGRRLKETPEDQRPSKVLFMITTDGYENASRKYSYKEINDMITLQRERYSWEFIFMGANIDAAKEAVNLGIDPQNARRFGDSAEEIKVLYAEADQVTRAYRSAEQMDDSWMSEFRKNARNEEDRDEKK